VKILITGIRKLLERNKKYIQMSVGETINREEQENY